MRWNHLLLGLLVMLLWGANGAVCRCNMIDNFPPFLFVSLRMFISAIPLIFFVPWPRFNPWVFAGLTAAVLAHHGFGLYAYRYGIGAGAAMLMMETQIFVTIFLARIFLKERVSSVIWLSVIVAFLGLVMVARSMHLEMGAPLFTFVLAGLAAAAWGINNIQVKLLGDHDTFSLVAWVSLAQAIPALFIAMLLDGPAVIWDHVGHLSDARLWALAYNGWGSGIIAFGGLCYLLKKYEASKVVPLSLLVPIFGVAIGVVFLDEPLNLEMLLGGVLVLLGVAIVEIPAFRLPAEKLVHHVRLRLKSGSGR